MTCRLPYREARGEARSCRAVQRSLQASVSKGDGGVECAAPKSLGDVGDAVCSCDVEDLRTQARHDAWIDAYTTGVFGEGHVANPMVLVLHSPMTADGAREDFRGQQTDDA